MTNHPDNNTGAVDSTACVHNPCIEDSSGEEVQALLPTYIQDWLNSCPSAGAGVHHWLTKVAVRLHRFFDDKNCIATLLKKHCAGCGREVSDTEIWNAINDTERWLAEQNVPGAAKARKVVQSTLDTALVESIVKNGPTFAMVEAQSPVRWCDGVPHTEEVLSTLFPPRSLICVGQSESRFQTVPLEPQVRLRLLRSVQYIVPSPMLAKMGKTKGGKPSEHTLSNTGPRRFLIIEFDSAPTDTQASVLWHLGQRERLVLVVHSGGKSLHGWFFVAGRDEQALREFMDYSIGLGADPKTWTKSQFVRMPDGRRDDGKRQRIVFFNPEKLEAQ